MTITREAYYRQQRDEAPRRAEPRSARSAGGGLGDRGLPDYGGHDKSLAGAYRRRRPEDEGSWRDMALCAGIGPDAFMVDGDSDRTGILWSQLACRACPVREVCAQYACRFGATDLVGVWGGLTARNRQTLRRRGEFIDRFGDRWLRCGDTGEVTVIESPAPPWLTAESARTLLTSLGIRRALTT